jgi:hypothetical protein
MLCINKVIMDFKAAAGLWKHVYLENSNALLLYLYFEGDPGEL